MANAEQRIEDFKNRNGCEGRISENPRQTYGSINFHSCYCNHLDENFHHSLALQENYNKGFLPFSGGYLEQPNKAMEIINLISNLRIETERKEQEKVNKAKK